MTTDGAPSTPRIMAGIGCEYWRRTWIAAGPHPAPWRRPLPRFPRKARTGRMGATLAGQLSSRGGAGYRAHPQGARATEACDAKTGPGSDQACEETGRGGSRSQKAADAEDQLPDRALVRRGRSKDERGAERPPGVMVRCGGVDQRDFALHGPRRLVGNSSIYAEQHAGVGAPALRLTARRQSNVGASAENISRGSFVGRMRQPQTQTRRYRGP